MIRNVFILEKKQSAKLQEECDQLMPLFICTRGLCGSSL